MIEKDEYNVDVILVGSNDIRENISISKYNIFKIQCIDVSISDITREL